MVVGTRAGGVTVGSNLELLKAETRFLRVLGGVDGAEMFLAAATVCARFASRAFARMSTLVCFVPDLRDAFPFLISSDAGLSNGFLTAFFPGAVDPFAFGGMIE